MKIDREGLNHCIDISKQCILSKKQFISIKQDKYLVWPLFFMEGEQPREDAVDVCTSALGIISSSFFIRKNIEDEITCTIRDGISTLLFVRNTNGSWPSKVSLVAKDYISMEGVISDTYFALSALLSVDFISNEPLINNIFDPQQNKVLNNIEDRLDIVQRGVQWLLDNRVNQGWGYTGINYLEDVNARNTLPAYTLPSINAIIVVSNILEKVKIVKPDFPLCDKMELVIIETVNWLCEVQNADGGFGIKRGEKSRLGNTSKAIIALCSVLIQDNNRNRVINAINKAVKWLISNYNPKKIYFEDVSEDFSQFIMEDIEGKLNAFKRTILHESFLEPLVIDSLRIYYIKFLLGTSEISLKRSALLKNKIIKTIRTATEVLIGRQKKEGEIQGAVKSRRAAQNEWYTMYTCSDLICCFVNLLNSGILVNSMFKASFKQKLLILLYMILTFSIILPVVLSGKPLWLGLFLLIINPVAINLLSSIIEKVFIETE